MWHLPHLETDNVRVMIGCPRLQRVVYRIRMSIELISIIHQATVQADFFRVKGRMHSFW